MDHSCCVPNAVAVFSGTELHVRNTVAIDMRSRPVPRLVAYHPSSMRFLLPIPLQRNISLVHRGTHCEFSFVSSLMTYRLKSRARVRALAVH